MSQAILGYWCWSPRKRRVCNDATPYDINDRTHQPEGPWSQRASGWVAASGPPLLPPAPQGAVGVRTVGRSGSAEGGLGAQPGTFEPGGRRGRTGSAGMCSPELGGTTAFVEAFDADASCGGETLEGVADIFGAAIAVEEVPDR